MYIKSRCYIVAFWGLFLTTTGFSQAILKINTEVVYSDQSPAQDIQIQIKDEWQNELTSSLTNTDGKADLNVIIGQNYYLIIEDSRFQKEHVFIETKSSQISNQKIWPVYVKIKLKLPQESPSPEAKVHFDSTLKRFDYQINIPTFKIKQKVFSGHIAVYDSNVTKSNQVLDPEERQQRQDMFDKEQKQAHSRDILSEVNAHKRAHKQHQKKGDFNVDLYLKQLDRKKKAKFVFDRYETDYLKEMNIEHRNQLIKSHERRRFLEEVAENKRQKKQQHHEK